MFWEIFIKLLTYSIVITVVKLVINRVFEAQKEYKVDKEGNNYIDRYILGKIYFILAIICTIIIIFVSSFPSNIQGRTKIIVYAILIGFNIMLYVVAIMFRICYIKFGKNKIIYRNMLGKIRGYRYADIDYGVLSYKEILTLYSEGKQIIQLLIGKERLCIIDTLEEKGVEVKIQSIEKEFIIEESNFYKGLSLLCVISFIGFTSLCIYINLLYGYLFCIVMLILSVFDLLKKLKKRIIVSSEYIIVKEFLKKEKQISFSKIKNIERMKKDGAEVIYVYSDNGLEFKYRSINKNADIFEGIIIQNEWKEKS